MARILVVDDDPAIVEVVTIVLEEDGYVVEQDTGEHVERLVVATQPDAVLLDIWMNGVDGRELAKRLKLDYPGLPVILMSAHSSSRSAVAETGADGFLEKPFEVEDLLAIVGQHVNGVTPQR